MEKSEILDKNWTEVEQVVQNEFPPILYGVGYGSGVIPQTGYNYTENMPLIDLIFVVDNVKTWHQQNWRTNRHHYTGK